MSTQPINGTVQNISIPVVPITALAEYKQAIGAYLEPLEGQDISDIEIHEVFKDLNEFEQSIAPIAVYTMYRHMLHFVSMTYWNENKGKSIQQISEIIIEKIRTTLSDIFTSIDENSVPDPESSTLKLTHAITTFQSDKLKAKEAMPKIINIIVSSRSYMKHVEYRVGDDVWRQEQLEESQIRQNRDSKVELAVELQKYKWKYQLELSIINVNQLSPAEQALLFTLEFSAEEIYSFNNGLDKIALSLVPAIVSLVSYQMKGWVNGLTLDNEYTFAQYHSVRRQGLETSVSNVALDTDVLKRTTPELQKVSKSILDIKSKIIVDKLHSSSGLEHALKARAFAHFKELNEKLVARDSNQSIIVEDNLAVTEALAAAAVDYHDNEAKWLNDTKKHAALLDHSQPVQTKPAVTHNNGYSSLVMIGSPLLSATALCAFVLVRNRINSFHRMGKYFTSTINSGLTFMNRGNRPAKPARLAIVEYISDDESDNEDHQISVNIHYGRK